VGPLPIILVGSGIALLFLIGTGGGREAPSARLFLVRADGQRRISGPMISKRHVQQELKSLTDTANMRQAKGGWPRGIAVVYILSPERYAEYLEDKDNFITGPEDHELMKYEYYSEWPE
jgi:hypothetical protein